MRVESIKAQTDKERNIRRRFHAHAVLEGKTMRELTFEAMEFYLLKNEKK